MIIVHTGVNGTGKTLAAVDLIFHDKDYKTRPVYYHGIHDLKKGRQIYCKNLNCKTCREIDDEAKDLFVEEWYEYSEPTALFLIDEAQHPFPQRKKEDVPKHVSKLTEHRFDGIDFLILTQNAMFLDVDLRRLVERHIHFVKAVMFRWKYTHNEIMANDAALKFGSKSFNFLKKRSFKYYKSAEVHTKIRNKIPFAFYLLGFIVFLLLPIGYWIINQVNELRGRSDSPSEQINTSTILASSPQQETQLSRFTRFQPSQELDRIFNIQPQRRGYPETSPAFINSFIEQETARRYVPKLSGCVHRSGTNEFRAFDQNGFIYQTTLERCLALINNGRTTFEAQPSFTSPNRSSQTTTQAEIDE